MRAMARSQEARTEILECGGGTVEQLEHLQMPGVADGLQRCRKIERVGDDLAQ